MRQTLSVLTGIWHEINEHEVLRFEAYLIPVLAASGQVRAQPYQLEIFDWDRPGDGSLGKRTFNATSPEELAGLIRMVAEIAVRKDILGPILGEAFPIAGVIWYPVGHQLPLIVCEAVGMRRLTGKNDRGCPPAYSVTFEEHRPAAVSNRNCRPRRTK